MPVLSKRIVLDCFYLLIFYFEKFSTDVCRLPCAVNVNLNLSIKVTGTFEKRAPGFLKSIRLITNSFLTLYSVCKTIN